MLIEPENVIHQLAVGDAAAIAEIVERAQTSDDVTTLVAAALFTPATENLMARRGGSRAGRPGTDSS